MNIYLLIFLKVVYFGYLRGHYLTFVFGGDSLETAGEKLGSPLIAEFLITPFAFFLAVFLSPIPAFIGTLVAFFLLKYIIHNKHIKLWNGIVYPFIGRVDVKIINFLFMKKIKGGK